MELKNFLLCLLLCFLLSFLIGVERQYRGRIIGLRTTILVSVGAFLYVSMSFYVSNNDVTRIAAQVVSGIGFLGAGVIIKDGLKVRGLTTAATLWCDAAVGVLCAAGALYHAIAGTIIILFSNIILRYVNRMVNKKNYERHAIATYEISVTANSDVLLNIKKCVNDFIKENNRLEIELESINMINNGKETIMKISLSIRKTYNSYIDQLIDNIYSKFKVDNLKYDKILENQREEEEEL